MIIVFFHVLYLIGKIVYDNYQCNRVKNKGENGDDQACSSPVLQNNTTNEAQRNNDLPDLYDADDEDDDDFLRAPRFSPPAFIQRYVAVIKVLTDAKYHKKIKKVVDFGCSELGFLVYLKRTPGIQEILCVDIDADTLNRHKEKAIPLNADFLQNRSEPLTIHIYEGSVTHRDKILANCDAVIAIELIEHLYPETLADFPYNVFGFIKPLVAIITTPNADFNVLFPRMKKTDLRHWDHKFEWTREQFEDWAKNIVTRYPEYTVSFEGVGPGPPGTEELGCCSQMAIFTKLSTTTEVPTIFGIEGLLKKVESHEYPYRVDNRSDEQKILDEATYHIAQFTRRNEDGAEEYPLEALLKTLENFHITGEALREILVNGGWTISDGPEGPMILCPDGSTFSDYEADIDIEDNWPELDSNAVGFDNDLSNWREDNVEAVYDECWDDDYELPAVVTSLNQSTSQGIAPGDSDAPEVEFSSSRSLDAAWSLDRSFQSVQQDRLANFESEVDTDSAANGQDSSIEIVDEENTISNVEAIVRSSSLMKNKEETPVRLSRLSKLELETSGHELGSLCSINLERSRNDERETCPRNITNPGFDCTELQRSFEDSWEARTTPDRSRVTSLSERFFSDDLTFRGNLESPRGTSSPRIPSGEKSQSQTSLPSSELASSTRTNSSTSFRTVKKWYPLEANEMYSNGEDAKLKGGNESSDIDSEEPRRELSDVSLSESFLEAERNSDATRQERQRTPASLSLRSNVSCAEILGNTSKMQEESKKAKNEAGRIADDEFSDSRQQGGAREIGGRISGAEDKAGSPEPPETPPNSWSPEIMDSGYPNTSSMQDTTPEYDLSSIAQDRISSDSESPSVAEVPRPGFLERAEVENGDLANNNRDGEGNNVVAAAEVENDLDDDLQPLIDGLENDIENENDIYALENDFPVWLLRILERGNVAGRQPIPELRNRDDNPRLNVNAAGDAGLPELDEGFDSTDDDDDDDDDDGANGDEDNVLEIFVESSEESIDWNVSGDH